MVTNGLQRLLMGACNIFMDCGSAALKLEPLTISRQLPAAGHPRMPDWTYDHNIHMDSQAKLSLLPISRRCVLKRSDLAVCWLPWKVSVTCARKECGPTVHTAGAKGMPESSCCRQASLKAQQRLGLHRLLMVARDVFCCKLSGPNKPGLSGGHRSG